MTIFEEAAPAEMIVDEAERHRHIDAAEALLRLIPTVDLETSIMGTGGEGEEPANAVGAGGPGPVVGEPDAGPSPGGELPRLGAGRAWHVYFEGRWWQWFAAGVVAVDLAEVSNMRLASEMRRRCSMQSCRWRRGWRVLGRWRSVVGANRTASITPPHPPNMNRKRCARERRGGRLRAFSG